ncbi:hypothetical protein EMCRGX_G016700 [Ephydatia muelleri]
MWNQTYVGEKLQRVGDVLKKKVLLAVGHEERETQDDGLEMIKQLKEKFAVASSRSEELTMLTILPKSWSVAKMMSLELRRKTLSQATLELVKSFYHYDDVSRVMPGKKDFASSRNDDGEKVHLQKRLVLCNLKEAYHHFKELHPNVKVEFLKFTQLQPKECVLAARLEALTKGEFRHYSDFLAYIQCDPPTADCANGICEECRGTQPLKVELEAIMEENGVKSVLQYSQWVNTDHTNLETHVVPVVDFLDLFMEYLLKLRLHDFIARQQAKFISEKKETLGSGEFLVVADFSENYSFVIQDERAKWQQLNSIFFTVILENNDHDHSSSPVPNIV